MLAILFLIGSALLGACVVRRALRGLLGGAEQLMWGAVVGWMLSALFVYGLARWQGRLSFGLMAWATVGVWLAAAALWVVAGPRLPRAARVAAGVRENVVLLVVLLLFAPVYWRLFSTHMLAPGEGGVYSGGSTWADLSFHAALATSFVYGANFPPVYTPLPPEPLLYPFLPDFQAAALMATGLSLRAALLLTAVPLALVVTGLLYQFAFRVARSRGAASLAAVLYLLGGGLGFTDLPRDWLKSGKGFFEFWNTLGVNYANAWDSGIHWNNVVTDSFLPQRTSLYGLAVGLMVFTFFHAAWRRWHGEDEGAPGPSSLLLAAGVLAGLLPLFHAHTYVAVGFVSVFLFLLRPRRAWLAFWATALLLPAPHLLELAGHATGGGFLRLLPGWMGHDAPNFPVYLLRNFGLPLALAVPALIVAPRSLRLFYLPFALLLAFALVVIFSPNTFDNGKVIYHWHALNSVLVGSLLYRLAAEWRQRLLATLLTLVCITSGLTALQSESLKRSLLFSDEDVRAAEFVRERTAPGSLFLTAPVINHPALSLAGRAVVRGEPSWAWSHGYEFRAREADVRRIYAGASDALELLNYYGVDYVYLGESERREMRADAAFFDANLRAVYRDGAVAVYEARPPTHGVVRTAPPPRELARRVGRDPFALLEEFSRVGLFVHKILKVANGRAPTRDEFTSSMKELGRGLHVGARGWEGQLSENRRALAARLANGDRARADELLAVASNKNFDAREYDEAYVRAHFFAYLGRDPDPEGFDFWLGILTRNRDYRSLSRAFLASDEYKNRPVER
ncbi:MAG TPA: hypothetical protein VF297_04790 [Pyrinomonadaceae bacterium]